MTGDSEILLRHSSSGSDDTIENDVDHKTNRTFQHPWIDSTSQIRLLRLTTRSSKHASTHTEAHLGVCDVSDLPTTEYIALSYCWGEARTAHDVRDINVDNQIFAVRTNLYNFLQTDAVAELRTPIYIDAICLNQLDWKERGCQVEVMADVYRNASKTIVWLGLCPDEQESNLGSLCKQLADHDVRHEQWASASLAGLSYLCSRVYWRRLWIVQELLLSKTVELRCGNFLLDWDAIAGLVSLPLSYQTLNEPEDAGWWSNWKIARPKDYSEQSAQEDQIRDGWQWAIRLMHNRAKWYAMNGKSINATPESSGLSFHEALIAFQHQQCRDRRDKVYALLGLLDEASRSMIKPDYSCTLRTLLTRAAATCLVSRWKSNGVSARSESGNHENRRSVEILCSMLSLRGLDVDTELSKAMQVAQSYIAELKDIPPTLATKPYDCQCNNANEEPSQRLPEPECTHDAEVEVGNGLHLFEQVFQSFKEELSTAELQEYPLTDRKALELSLATIQKKQRTMRAMRDMSRLRVFLRVLSTYEDLADSYLNVENTVAYIWAATRFLFEVTHTSPDAFDALLRSYQKLGENMPASDYVKTLSDNEFEQRDLVALLFHRLFGFHRLALHYFKKPAWLQLFTATWRHLEVQMSALVTTLGEYKSLLQDRAQVIELDESRRQITQSNTQLTQILVQANQTRLQAEEGFKQLGLDEAIRRRGHVINWLSAPDSLSDQDHGRAVRKWCPESGRWLLKDSRYGRWNNMEADEAPLLWLNAIPGAGKSVLASLVVDECSRAPDVTVMFFYFKHDNLEKNSFLAMTRSLLHPLSQRDDTLLPYLFDVATKRGENVLRTTKLAKEVLRICLNGTGKVCVVLDGIDECPEKEQKHITDFWIKHSEESRSGPNSCRCIMFSQDDASTQSLLASLPVIRICGEPHKADIGALCESWGERLRTKFNLNWQETNFLVTETKSRAENMFLFAHVVMENFYQQVNQADLFAELRSFPAGLNDAYARVVSRVTNAKLPLSRNAKRLLSWVACAIRPLKWREIQVAVSIDREMGVVDLENRQFRVSLKQLCGALLDERPNGDIEFVHHSAEQYLLNQGYVDLGLEHCKMTQLCLDYFALPAFSEQCTATQLHDYAKAGVYGFLDYTLAWWIMHLENAIDTCKGKDLPETLVQALETFFEQHWKEPGKHTKPTKKIDLLCGSIKSVDLCDKVKQTMSSMHFIMTTNSAKLGAVETLSLFGALIRIRAALESMSQHEKLEKYYGSRLFKCPRMYCKWFTEGFSQAQERKSHVEKHERSHLCPHSSCMYATVGFSFAKDLSRHRENGHDSAVTDKDFPAEQNDIPDHSRSPHEETSGPSPPFGSVYNNVQGQGPSSAQDEEQSRNPRPADIAPTLREYTEASRTAAQSREQTGEKEIHRVHAGERGQRTNIAQDLQCSMCTKVFTRPYNLRSHLRTHSAERPFNCSICGKGFTRQHDCNRHEAKHNGANFVFKEPIDFGSKRRHD